MTTSLGVAGVGLTAGAANAESTDHTVAVLAATNPTCMTVHLSAAGSMMGGGAVVANESYTFDCGVGGPAPIAAGNSADCVYTTPGDYTAQVSVYDGNPTVADGTDVKTLAVKALAPAAAVLTTVSIGVDGRTATADITGTLVDKATVGAGTPATGSINWGDGHSDPVAFDALGIGTVPTHTYAANTGATTKSWPVQVSVDDKSGRSAGATASSAVVNANLPGVAATAPAVNRGAGDDRILTGLKVSGHRWADAGVSEPTRTQANAVVLATANGFPDALAGVPLAKKANGPLLLTDGAQASVDYRVLNEIKRILPTAGTTIYILGGEKAISPGIQAQLISLGYGVTRLSGLDRFGTALDIAKRGMGDPAGVIVARGDEGPNHDGFADALSAGPYAANIFNGGNSAVVLSNYNSFDPATKAYVAGKISTTSIKVAAVGGQAVAAMYSIPGSSGHFAQAIGHDRFETAAKVAATFPVTAPVGVAYGFKFPDALTGGAYMATVGGPLLLTNTGSVAPYTVGAINRVASAAKEIDVFGGTAVISSAQLNEIAAMVHQTTIGAF